jgi:signal transduction histidine kinase
LLTRVLDNLLANARRASGDGEVLVALEPDGAGLLLSVSDDGPGVPPQSREAIFNAFVRLDDARTRDAGGAGLGLYLARQIAEAHGGALRVTDRRDGLAGARFELRLPVTPAPSQDSAAP